MKKILISLFMAAVSIGTYAADVPAAFASADSAYQAKDYVKAVELYRNVEMENGTSVALLYNMGNAYYAEGDYGNAMACYLRAHRLDPSDEQVNANLSYLYGRVEDANKAEQKGKRYKVSPDELSFFQDVHKVVAEDVSTNVWAIWAAVTFILFVGAVALYIFTRVVVLRKIGFFGGILLIAASFVFMMFAFMGARVYHSESDGVLTAFKTELLTEPGGKPENIEKAHVLTKGTVVKIVSEEVDAEGNVTWYKVRLNSDYIGWVAASDVIRV